MCEFGSRTEKTMKHKTPNEQQIEQLFAGSSPNNGTQINYIALSDVQERKEKILAQ
jgi:hypothetical protein